MPRLTIKELPSFIFLMDQIMEDDFDESMSIGRFSQKIANEGKNADNKVVGRTIERAFNLRENLKEGAIIKEDFNKPDIKTLNVLTSFYFEQKPNKFRIFEKKDKAKIQIHYATNKPNQNILDIIFKKKPPKIKYFEKREEKLTLLLDELNGLSLEDFVKFWIDEKLRESKKNKNYNKIKSELTEYIDYRLNDVKEKKKKASFFYRFFGSFGLFLVSIDYGEITINNLLDDFMDNHIMESDDFIDDII